MADAWAERLRGEAQAERDQDSVELAQVREKVAAELTAVREEARRERQRASADALRIREQALQEARAREASASGPSDSPDSEAASDRNDQTAAEHSTGSDDRILRSRTRRGQDATIGLDIKLSEAAFGTTRDVQLCAAVTCGTCDGEGAAPGTSVQMCDMCAGRGEVSQVTRSFLSQVMTSRPCPQCEGFGTVVPTPCP